jgi:hypothetical protein
MSEVGSSANSALADLDTPSTALGPAVQVLSRIRARDPLRHMEKFGAAPEGTALN